MFIFRVKTVQVTILFAALMTCYALVPASKCDAQLVDDSNMMQVLSVAQTPNTPACSTTDGSVATTVPCLCTVADEPTGQEEICQPETENWKPFCNVDTCTPAACSITDGSVATAKPCTCGPEEWCYPDTFPVAFRQHSSALGDACDVDNVPIGCRGVAAPTPSPTATPDAAGLFGDPHLTNIAGHKFMLHKAGTYVLLNVPQDSSVDSVLLRLEGHVAPVAAECSATFLQHIVVGGQWLGSTHKLKFSASPATASIAGSAPGLMVGNSSALSVPEFLDRVPKSMIKLSWPTKDVAAPTLVNRHATTMTASLKVGPDVGVMVSWVTERIPGMSLANGLWVSVRGLSSVHSPIGGLLGLDEHSDVSMPDAACSH